MGCGVIKATLLPVFFHWRIGLLFGLVVASYQPLFAGGYRTSMIIVN